MRKSLEVLVKESGCALVLGIDGEGEVVETILTSRFERNYKWKRYTGSDRLSEGKK